jgi:hypothetical protein
MNLRTMTTMTTSATEHAVNRALTQHDLLKAMELLGLAPGHNAMPPKFVMSRNLMATWMDSMDIPRFHVPQPEPRRQ